MAPAGLTIIVGEEVKTAEGDLICVFLDTVIPPGMSADGDDRGGARAGWRWWASRTRSTGCVARSCAMRAMASLAPHVDWVEAHNARVVGHGNEDAAAVRDRSGPARDRRLGCALDHGDRRRLHRARRRSVDARPGCSPHWPASRSSPAAPATSSGSGPRSPRASTACAATAASGPAHRRSHARLGWSPVTDQDGQDHRPMADGTDGPVGSGAMEATPAVDPAFGHHHDPESLVEALEMEPTEVAPISLGRRLTQPRTILSIIVPLAIIGFFLYLNRERLAAVPQPDPAGQPRPRPPRGDRLLPRLPAARLPLAAAPARDRLHHRPAQLDRDPVHLVVRQLRGAGQAR